MRIPLDYYRILGVPIQADLELIQQAHCDRLQQLPRYQHSTAAITARKQLLEEAFSVLSDAGQREKYDHKFLAQTYGLALDPKSQTNGTSELSCIEIADHQFPGALLLLYELGEYDLVLEIGQPYLSRGILDLKRPYTGSHLSEADIALTIALAHMELGREQWQQRYYEKSASSLQEGLDLLKREGLFPEVQAQLQADLYRLRPYRALELLALPIEQSSAHRQGLDLLQAMLAERQGIDGTGNDQSGLDIDSFLHFIQQLRSYLTAAEQQEIFEAETRRPSAVGTYLAFYALIARGFSEHQPALIRRANVILRRLTTHQDVYLEQASCTLLLGETEEALRIAERIQDAEAVSFMREHSKDAPDLLPGLCHYTQQWLQVEVYPYFRDLAQQQVDLNEYFADKQIQHYLDDLAKETATLLESNREANAAGASTKFHSGTNPQTLVQPPLTYTGYGDSDARARGSQLNSPTEPYPDWGLNLDLPQIPLPAIPAPPDDSLASTYPNGASRSLLPDQQSSLGSVSTGRSRSGHDDLRFSRRAIGEHRSTPSGLEPPVASRSSRSVKPLRLAVVGLTGILALGAIVVLGAYLLQLLRPSRPVPVVISGAASKEPTVSEPTQPLPYVSLDQPPVAIPSATAAGNGLSPLPATTPNSTTASPAVAVNAALTMGEARKVIQAWQRLKAVALGQNHEAETLSDILVEPALSRWQRTAQEGQAQQTYWQYVLKDLQIQSVTPKGSDRVEVLAQVHEVANFYAQGRRQPGPSYTDNYRVRYTLVRQGNQWRIQDMRVLG